MAMLKYKKATKKNIAMLGDRKTAQTHARNDI